MTIGNFLYTLILYPIIQIIEISFLVFDKIFSNTGVSVLGVSFVVTLLCLPLYIVAESWQETERKIQDRLSPGVKRIKESFKGDEQYMILSTFYRENHYHPMMALRSSFGLLIQIPFFMAAYTCLSHMQALKGQSFLFIRDMGAPDCLFKIGSFGINILPIAMTLINCISGTIYSKGHGLREKAQIYIMALLFLVVLYDSPAGLVLYWTMNNIFSLVKNIFYKMKHPVWTFYICMCTAIVAVVIYIIFIKHGGAPVKKLITGIFLLTLTPMPFYLKLVEWFLKNPLKGLMQNKKNRFILFSTASVSLCILIGALIPLNLISSSVQEFSNLGDFKCPTEFISWSLCQAAGIFIFWAFCVFFLFKEKIQTIIATVFSIAVICAVINTFVFPGSYGSMDVTLKVIDGIAKQKISFKLLNIASVLLIFAAVIFLIKINKQKVISNISILCSIVFIVFSLITSSKIKNEYKEFSNIASKQGNEKSNSTKFSLSKDKQNVIVLMLDRFPGCDFNEILKNEKEFTESLDGFTFYKNTASCNGHTLMGSPALYGGYEYVPESMNRRDSEYLKDKHNQALLLMPRIFTEQSDFTATISDTSWGNYSYIADMSFAKDYDKITAHTLAGRYTADWKKEFPTQKEATLEEGLKRNLLYFGFFRSSPAIIREIIYYNGTYLNKDSLDGIDKFIDWYSVLYYMPKIIDFKNNKNSFCMITNETTHFSDKIDSLNLIDKNTLAHPNDKSYVKQVVTLNSVVKLIEYMKENNCYDNTKIIIISDHGSASDYKEDFENPTDIGGYSKTNLNPILLVKNFNERHSVIINDSFMTNADVPTIAFEGIIESPRNPFTGKIVNSKEKEDGVLVTTGDIFMPFHSKSNKKFTVSKDSWYRVKNSIFKADCWSKEYK